MTIKEKSAQVVSEFEQFDDWLDKYSYLIELGKSIPMIDEQYRKENYLIKGCQSRVYLHAAIEDGIIRFSADSDAVITKGIASLLIRVFTDSSPDELLEADTSFIDEIGLKSHLSPTRSNGLMAMMKQMKLYALAFKTKNQAS